MEHIHQDRGPATVAVVAVFGLIALFCLIARLGQRLTSGNGLWIDDYLMIAAAVGCLSDHSDMTSAYLTSAGHFR